MVVSVLIAVFLPDSPVKVKRFTDAEEVAAIMRVRTIRGRFGPDNS